jgi:hypothetical protein
MKRFLLGLFVLSAQVVSVLPAFADNPVDITVNNIVRGISVTGGRQPLTVSIKNSGNDAATGFVTLGSDENRVRYSYQVGAHGKTSFVAFSPYYQKEPPRGSPPPAADDHPPYYVNVDTTEKLPGRDPIASHEVVPIGIYDNNVYLSISTKLDGLGYLRHRQRTKKIRTGSGSSDQTKSLSNQLNEDVNAANIRPKEAFTNGEIYVRYRGILLGEGSRELTGDQVGALKEYVLSGGQILFSDAANSGKNDPRWSSLMPEPGKSRYFAFGRLVDLGYNPEEISSYDPARVGTPQQSMDAARTRFLLKAIQPLRLGPMQLTGGRSPNEAAQMQATGPDPFQSTLPSFGKVAMALMGYFVIVVPLNVLLLRKLQRPELMWITAPFLAVAFSLVIFRSAAKLYQAPMSISAIGALVSAPESPREFLSSQVAIFSPQATAYGWRLENTQIVEPYYNWRDRNPKAVDLPTVTDTGTLDVPDYRPTNLEFREVELVQDPPTQERVKFSIGNSARGLYTVTATNIGNQEIDDVAFVAGEYSTFGRTLEPGKSIAVVVDHVRPLPQKLYDKAQEDRSSSQEPPQMDPSSLEQNLKQCAMVSQLHGQVALFGTINGVPIGPNPARPHAFHSQVVLAAYPPVSLKLP